MEHITQIQQEYVDIYNDVRGNILTNMIRTHLGRPTQEELNKGSLLIWDDSFKGMKGYEREAKTTYYTITIPLKKNEVKENFVDLNFIKN